MIRAAPAFLVLAWTAVPAWAQTTDCPGTPLQCLAAEAAFRLDVQPILDPCGAVGTLVDRMDLSSFPNSRGPRLEAGQRAVPSEMFLPVVLPLCAGVALMGDGWAMGLTPLGLAGGDLLVLMDDRAMNGGTYAGGALLGVPLVDGDDPLPVTVLCDWVDDAVPDASCLDD
ncbi:hypothetical protein [Jannaschia sp. LMIT008]|uniref:hypothetical protein n=1 Tax=Jannaschia maritima TaxID=3032585 RepID=UPI0028119C33|nr:hypothetical protein [Jannaschia sp. LMIT008]